MNEKENNFEIGDKVIIKKEGYLILTDGAVEKFLKSGEKELKGVVVEKKVWGSFAIKIEDGIKYGFESRSNGKGIITILPKYLIKIGEENE